MDEDIMDIPELEKGGGDMSDDEFDERKHEHMLESIGAMDGKKRTPKLRTEAAPQVSEFNLAGGEKVKLHEMISALKHTASHGELKKQINRVHKKQKGVTVPLPRHQQEKADRSVGYEATKKEVSKWEPVIEKNRKAEQMKFPLNQPDIRLHKTTEQLVKQFQPRTPLEMEVAAMLHGSENVLKSDKILTPAEEKALRAMSIEEAQARRAELQKYRALLSYKEAKARRQNKIKSKQFHRILRKEKMKKEKRAMDELQEKDPEAYADTIFRMDKDRIQERMSLKHRGGSKFMKRQTIFGKYDDDGRQAVQDMIQKNKQLTQKMQIESESDGVSEGDEEDETQAGSSKQLKNPWMGQSALKKPAIYHKPSAVTNPEAAAQNQAEESSDEEDIIESKKIKLADDENEDDSSSDEEEENSAKPAEKSAKKKSVSEGKSETQMPVENHADNSESEDESEEELDPMRHSKLLEPAIEVEDEEGISSSLIRKRTLDNFKGNTIDPTSLDEVTPTANPSRVAEEPKTKKTDEIHVDPKKFLTVETSLRQTQLPNMADDSEGELDPEEQQRMTIAQAFAADDVVEEFSREKGEMEEKQKVKDIDLTLPGWGEWGGTGLRTSKRKRKRFRIKVPDAPPRRDRGLNNVIISETKDTSVAKHQVSDLPFPFGNVKQFESSIRQPIGKTWNPETAFKDLVKPKVITRLGTVINPIDKAETFKHKKMKQEKEKKVDKRKKSGGKRKKKE